MQVLIVGLNIKDAPVEMLEALSIHHSDTKHCLEDLSVCTGAEGVLILSTCNRLEFYAAAENAERCMAALQWYLLRVYLLDPEKDSHTRELEKYVYGYSGAKAVQHLYRVVAGLDSLVLGETEILGQVARAYEQARTAGVSCKLLNVWFQRALSVGKLVRTRFKMDRHHTSLGRIAVDLAEHELDGLEHRRILILGAGEMCELTMKHLISKSNSLVMVSNRSLTKAQQLADEYGFEARSLHDLAANLALADVVFSATSSKNHLVSLELLKEVMPKRNGRPLVFIDMAVPRDIDPRVEELSKVRRFDIKQLRFASDLNQKERRRCALAVEALINEKVDEFLTWQKLSKPLAMKSA